MFTVSASSHSQYEIQFGDTGYDPKIPLTSLVFGNQAHQIQLLQFNKNVIISSSCSLNMESTDGQKAKHIYEQSNPTFPFNDQKLQH